MPTLAEALASLDDEATGSRISQGMLGTRSPSESGEPQEETIDVPPAPPDSHRPWTLSGLLPAPPPPNDEWAVTNVGSSVKAFYLPEVGGEQSNADDGTPIEGVLAVAPPVPVGGANFVAGEIDVPTPAPHRTGERIDQPTGIDPDTGSHTPPIERR
jgi:hypothetical protein